MSPGILILEKHYILQKTVEPQNETLKDKETFGCFSASLYSRISYVTDNPEAGSIFESTAAQ
jgi:hypothetical protein